MLSVTIKTKPNNWFLKVIRVLFFYISGKHFKISVYVKNHGQTTFQGGTIKIHVRYAFGQFQETIEGKIDIIKPDKRIPSPFLTTFETFEQKGVGGLACHLGKNGEGGIEISNNLPKNRNKPGLLR